MGMIAFLHVARVRYTCVGRAKQRAKLIRQRVSKVQSVRFVCWGPLTGVDEFTVVTRKWFAPRCLEVLRGLQNRPQEALTAEKILDLLGVLWLHVGAAGNGGEVDIGCVFFTQDGLSIGVAA